jgi:uncharacterized protein YqgC (DUF456 family)
VVPWGRVPAWHASGTSRTTRPGRCGTLWWSADIRPCDKPGGNGEGSVIGIGELFLVAFVMAVGLIGVLLPVVPGLILVWAAGLWWTIADGGGAARWAVLVVMTGLFVAGTLAKYILPARATAAGGVGWSTLAVGALGAVVGFFLIPVVGLLVGGIVGIYVAEQVRLGDWRRAVASTRAALVAFGIGILVELAAGLGMALTWFAGELAI